MRLRQTLAALSLAATTVTIPAVAGISGTAAAAAPDSAAVHIVLLDDSVADPAAVAAEHSKRYGAQVKNVYSHAVKGYAASFKGTGAADVAHDRRVAIVERDQVVSVEAVSSWGLDRIDQVSRTLDQSYTPNNTGVGVTAYIIDSGIQTGHQDFHGRASVGTDTVGDGRNGQDCNGHGTHVAGTVGGTEYGVAKAVDLVAVRVLNCAGSGSWSGVIGGIDWVANDHVNGRKTPAVANMSLGGGASTAVDTAVKNAIASGVTFAVAAGNGNAGGVAQDACKSSPARVADALTIGATDSNDRKASWSNYGKCVDWFAPGVGITSAWIGNNSAVHTISGTSMATPHTAGVAALFLQTVPGATPAAVRTALFNTTLQGIVTSSKTTTNHLLFTNGL